MNGRLSESEQLLWDAASSLAECAVEVMRALNHVMRVRTAIEYQGARTALATQVGALVDAVSTWQESVGTLADDTADRLGFQ